MRLIDADRLLNHAIAFFTGCHTSILQFSYVSDMIINAPAVDAVPVIRCRDCKLWEPYGSKGTRNGEDLLEREGGCMKWRGRHLESDFCSYGKRKDKNNA